jgi:hypothetical protein
MPDFSARNAISANTIKAAIKGNLIFLGDKPLNFLRNGSVVNFRNFGGDKTTGNTTIITGGDTPTPIRTVGQLFP